MLKKRPVNLTKLGYSEKSHPLYGIVKKNTFMRDL